MGCINVTQKGNKHLEIAEGVVGSRQVAAINEKYTNDLNNNFDGFDKTVSGVNSKLYSNLYSKYGEEVAVKTIAALHSPAFISEFGAWTKPLQQSQTDDIDRAVKFKNLSYYSHLNLSLPAALKWDTQISKFKEAGYEIKYLDAYNQTSNVKTNKPVFILNNILYDIDNNIIDNLNTYEVVNSKVNDLLEPVVYRYESNLVVDTQAGKFVVNELPDIYLEDLKVPRKGGKESLTPTQPITIKDFNFPVSAEYSTNVAKQLTETFSKHGLNVEFIHDETLEGSAKINKDGNKVTITFNNNKLQQDSFYHEFGHLYVDLITDTNFINIGIEQVKGTTLWNNIQKIYPNYSDEQLGKEVLTTLIGRNAEKYTDSKLKFWLDRLFIRIAELFNIEVDVAKKLAIDLTSGNLTKVIDNRVEMQEQWQKDEETANAVKVVQDFLHQRKGTLNDIYEKYKQRASSVELRADTLKTKSVITEALRAKESEVSLGEVEAISAITAYDIKWLSKTEKALLDMTDKYINSKKPLDTLTEEHLLNLSSALSEINQYIDSFVHIENMGIFTEKEMKEYLVPIYSADSDIITGYDIRDTLSEEARVLAEAMLKMENIRNDLSVRINRARKQTQSLIDYTTSATVAKSSNPDMIIEGLSIVNMEMLGESWFHRTFLNNFNSTNVITSTVERLIRSEKDNYRKRAAKMKEEFKLKLKELNITKDDIKELYIDDDGNLTTRLIQEYNRKEFYKEVEKIQKLRRDFSTEKKEEIINSLTDQPYSIEALNELIEKEEKRLSRDKFNKWVYDNFYYSTENERFEPKLNGDYKKPKSIFKSARYNSIHQGRLGEFYDYLLGIQKELASHVMGSGINKGDIPIIDADEEYSKERLIEKRDSNGELVNTIRFKNVGDVINTPEFIIPNFNPELNTKEAWEIQTVDYANVKAKENNLDYRFAKIADIHKANKEIRKNNKIKRQELTDYNLEVVFPIFIDSAFDHKYKTTVEPIYLTALDSYARANIKVETSKGIFKKNVGDRDENKELKDSLQKGEDTAGYKAFKKRMDMQIYDNFLLPNDANTLLKGYRNYIALSGLGFNVFAAAKNLGMGKAQLRIEATAGIHFDNNDLTKANKLYRTATTSILSDRNEELKGSSKVSSIIKYFNPIEDYSDILEQANRLNLTREEMQKLEKLTNKLKTKFNKAAFGMTTIIEHQLHSIPLLAMLQSHKIIDGKITNRNKYVNQLDAAITPADIQDNKREAKNKIGIYNERRKKLQEEFETKGITLYDALSFDETTGYITVKPEFKDILTERELSYFRNKVLNINHKMHGIYNREDKGIIENSMVGQLIMQFKHWLPSMWVDRFGKSGNPFDTKTYWDEGLQEERIGNYNAIWKMVGKSTKPFIDEIRNEDGSIDTKAAVVQFLKGILKEMSATFAGRYFFYFGYYFNTGLSVVR